MGHLFRGDIRIRDVAEERVGLGDGVTGEDGGLGIGGWVDEQEVDNG